MSTYLGVPEDWADPQSLRMSSNEERVATAKSSSRTEGLWRAVLGESGHAVAEAFASLEHSPDVERVVRHERRDLVGGRVTLTPEEGEGYWELTRIRDDFNVILVNFSYINRRFELVPGDGLIQLNFKISGDMSLVLRCAEPLPFNRPSRLVWGQSPGVDVDSSAGVRTQERMVVISVRPEFLMEHFLTSIVDLPPQLQAFVSNPRGSIGYCQLPLTAEMFAVASKLVENSLNGKLALVYAEALTLELLCTAVASFCTSSALVPEGFTERSRRCLQMARNALVRQLSPAPTIRQISRQVGMGETALKRGFKALYGETVFDFSVRCRMQHALKLLRDQRWSVDKVSEATGYSHPTSFATAFRRHFGLRPVEVRCLKTR